MASLFFTTPQFSHFRSAKPIKSLNSNEPIHLIQLSGSTANHQTPYKSYFHAISSLCKHGQIQQAVDFLTEMDSRNLPAGPEIYGELLQGCVYERDLSTGQQIHAQVLKNGRAIYGYAIRHDLGSRISISTALVDMYTKCGCLSQAKMVFDSITSNKLPVYNAMTSAYAIHGQAGEALVVFRNLEEASVEPDGITFTSVLSSCTHSGLVNEGLEIFVDMVSKHHFSPSMEHYGCLVSLLSRSGRLDEAFRLILTMPYELDAQIIGSLLAKCRERDEIELVEQLSKYLLELELDNLGNYVAISNAYVVAGRWEEVSEIRDLMKEKGLKKSPGCSWIQIGEKLHSFIAGDGSHPSTEEIQATLALLGTDMNSSA
ncbi:chlororespiratory reduction 21 [Hibiscus trionum]|uniref:Chlororespiratory reduction 21 n=1 Tax=Hibiscus trionum TaxID=183268 RepID=A0A9W7GSK8_HIBTR|nr:chlororespiratory reduction 21 [Hibiscus trionum]